MLTVYTSSGDFALSDGGGLTVWSWGKLPGVTVVVVSWVPPPPIRKVYRLQRWRIPLC